MRKFLFLLGIFLRNFHSAVTLEWPLKKKSYIDGDLILGGFFPVHARDREMICGKLQDEGLIELEAMLYTIEVINNDSLLLPGIKLGAIAVDSCDSIPQALEEAVDFAKGFVIREDSRKSNITPPFTCGNKLPHFESGLYERVVAIIGGHSSWVSRQVADLMRIYKMPQISYQSTDPALSDLGYEYFFRTIPPLNHQMRVITEILKAFDWKYFAVVYADSAYGNKGVEVLWKLMQTQYKSFCISSLQRINVENSKSDDYDFVLSELLRRNATAVIVFGDHEMARNLIAAATRARAYRRFVWIGSTAWVGRDYVIAGNEEVLEGAIGVNHDLKPFHGFEDYMKSRDLETHRKMNPWFPEYWEKNLHCRVSSFEDTPFNGNYTKACPEDAKLPPNCYKQVTPTVQFVRDAVYSVAHALQDIYSKECKKNNLCLELRGMNGEELKKHLSKVEFEDENKNMFRFDDKGNGPPRYTIVNLQRIEGRESLYWVPVGTYYEPDLNMEKSAMKYKQANPVFPESLCSSRCKDGQAQILLDEANCCWHCTDCLEYQFVKDGVQCKDCPTGTLPNLKKDGCIPIDPLYMDYTNPWAVGCIIFSLVGILSTICAAVVIGKYWDTPVVTSSGREFCFIILVGIVSSFSLTFATVAKPSDAACAIVRFFVGVYYTISYAGISVKIHYLSRLSARSEANKKPKPINMKPLILIALSLVAVEGTINAAWLIHSPPTTDHQYPSKAEKIFICKGSDTGGYLIGLLFPFLLVLFCTIYGLKIRNFAGAFNESRYINLTNLTTCVLWLAFLPMFLLNNNYLIRVVVITILLNLSAMVQLVVLFLPKVYIALRRPEKNKHENIMCYDIRQSSNTGI